MASDTEADSTAFRENDVGFYAQLKEGCLWGVHRKPLLLQKDFIQISELDETKANKPGKLSGSLRFPYLVPSISMNGSSNRIHTPHYPK